MTNLTHNPDGSFTLSDDKKVVHHDIAIVGSGGFPGKHIAHILSHSSIEVRQMIAISNEPEPKQANTLEKLIRPQVVPSVYAGGKRGTNKTKPKKRRKK